MTDTQVKTQTHKWKRKTSSGHEILGDIYERNNGTLIAVIQTDRGPDWENWSSRGTNSAYANNTYANNNNLIPAQRQVQGRDLTEGMHIVGCHGDDPSCRLSPWIDLVVRVYEHTASGHSILMATNEDATRTVQLRSFDTLWFTVEDPD